MKVDTYYQWQKATGSRGTVDFRDVQIVYKPKCQGHNILQHLFSLLFSSMRGRQQLSCPVLRPPSGLNARPQDNIHLT